MDFWHMQMNQPEGRESDVAIDSKELLEKHSIIGSQEWDSYQCEQFKGAHYSNHMKIGDIVVVREGSMPIALCKITSDFYEDPKIQKEYEHCYYRDVEILDWDKGNRSILKAQGTISISNPGNETYEVISNWYKEVMNMQLKQKLTKLLEASSNIVLTGAPGTGKTYLAKEIAEKLTGTEAKGSKQIAFVQFHSSYDYTDFVEGLRPVEKDGKTSFELRDGIFKEFCKKAAKDPKNPYVFIIDEINRAEPSRVLGELFFAIDPGYRGTDGIVKTQYANINTEVMHGCNEKELGEFYVPKNVYIIGTMNDIDRSVDSIDFAMRRRFVWREITVEDTIPQMFNSDIMKEYFKIARHKELQKEYGGNDAEKSCAQTIRALNTYIDTYLPELGSAFHIGPAYFLRLDDYLKILEEQGMEGLSLWNAAWKQLWEYHIRPLLAEYLRGIAEKEKHLESFATCWLDEDYPEPDTEKKEAQKETNSEEESEED